MENVSVKQRPALPISLPEALDSNPLRSLPTEAESVEGPVMAKVKKSKRIWQMSSAHLQRRVRQPPAAAVLPVFSK